MLPNPEGIIARASQSSLDTSGRSNDTRTSRIGLCCECGVSYGVSAVFPCHAHRKVSDWSVSSLSAAASTLGTGPLVGDVQCSIWPMTPVEPSAPPVSVTRVGRVMALRKRNQTQQAEKNQNFKYHFHIPLSHTTAKINQKVVYTTQIPVNHQHCTCAATPHLSCVLLKP